MLITIIIQSKHIALKIFIPLILDAHTQNGNSVPFTIQKQLIFYLYAISYLRIQQ